MHIDVPYHPPPEELDESPYTDLKIDEFPPTLDWHWKMRHGIIDVRGNYIYLGGFIRLWANSHDFKSGTYNVTL